MVVLNALCLLALAALAHCKTVRQTADEIQAVEDYIDSRRAEINQRYRPHYHIAGPVGWINDPNGFSYYKSDYHLFYQFYPYDSVWGPMHWGHVVSRDLVHWEYLPTALVPGEELCFSGSAVADGDTMILMYTGHVDLDAEPWTNQSQYLAYSDDGVTFRKYEGNPVIPAAPNGSPDFRDPKVWRYGDNWYVVIGSNDNNIGRVLLYKSSDMKNWEFLRVMVEGHVDSDIYECPDFFELGGKYILIISPQFMESEGDRYQNIHQTGYIIGTFNYDTYDFIPEVDFQEFDYGHDFYAAQTTEAYGRRFLVSWFNMWDMPHPEEEDGWSGTLTLIRELNLVGNRITMKPVQDMISLRDEEKLWGILQPEQEIRFGKTAEILVFADLTQKVEIQLEGTEGGSVAWLRWEPEVGKVVVDRGSGDIRQGDWSPIGSQAWRIFLDASSLELFCGEGEVVFSSRLFPSGDWLVTNKSPQALNVQAFTLSRSVPYSDNSQNSIYQHSHYRNLIVVFIILANKLYN